MLQQIFVAFRMMTLLTVLIGFVYSGAVTAVARLCFKDKAGGSLLRRGEIAIGSSLIGQRFSRPEYFHSRPSAAVSFGSDSPLSGGSNLGPTSRQLVSRVRASIEDFRKENPGYPGSIPSDLVTASGSGLDPHISPVSAELQISRVAAARGIPEDQVRRLVASQTERPDLGLIGEPRLNILLLNLALDERFPLMK